MSSLVFIGLSCLTRLKNFSYGAGWVIKCLDEEWNELHLTPSRDSEGVADSELIRQKM